MLPESHQNHLVTQLNKKQYLIASILVQMLQIYRCISLEELATKFPSPILFESRRKKLQRFLDLPILTIEAIWIPIILAYIKAEYTIEDILNIAIDRTKWKQINLMTISLNVNGRAIPIYFELLPHQGSSDVETQKMLLGRVLPLLRNYRKVILGDREFCSVDLAKWLKEQKKTYFCLRLKKSEYVKREAEVWISLNEIGLNPGIAIYLKGVKVTKTKGFSGANIACKWKRKYRGLTAKEGWFILTNFDSLEQAINSYKERFGIEEMFRDFKSGGYNLEDTLLTDKRLMSMIILVTLAYSQATLSGKIIKKQGLAKYVGRVKEKSRTNRRHSDFYLGLHAQGWIESLQMFAVEIQALMNLSGHKCANYQQALRAASLILSTF